MKFAYYADAVGRIFALPVEGERNGLHEASDAELAAWCRSTIDTKSGSAELLTIDQAKRRGLKVRNDPPPASSSKRKCGGCSKRNQAAPLVRWLRIRWIGTPLPKRFRLAKRWPFVRLLELPGCGCIHRMKRELEIGRLYWAMFRDAVRRRLDGDVKLDAARRER